MTLHFPNAIRHYNPTKHCVSFLGYDSVFEIAFDLDEKVLLFMSAPPTALEALKNEAVLDETFWLKAFDTHRARIEEVARAVYRRLHGNRRRPPIPIAPERGLASPCL
jgi:hypothetical protein